MIYQWEGNLSADFIGEPRAFYHEVTEVGGVPHVVIEHREDSFLAVPLRHDKIYELPVEAAMYGFYSLGYKDTIDCRKAVEIAGAVWVFGAKDGGAEPIGRADSFQWP